jgi:hypothetical protein
MSIWLQTDSMNRVVKSKSFEFEWRTAGSVHRNPTATKKSSSMAEFIGEDK